MNAITPAADDPATLLVVDDDRDIRLLLANSLGARGYRVETASNTRDMDDILAKTPVDLVILDVMMPGEDGLSACRRIARQDGPEVIFLSALGDEQDQILGLEVGAGHYLPKPCSPREILATVRAALRKRGAVPAAEGDVYTFEGWRIDLGSHELFDPDGVLVGLTDGEFAVLRVFIERPRRVLTREALLAAARGPDSDAYDRAIDVQVSRLRRKLRSGGDEIIRTVRNEGYLFVPQSFAHEVHRGAARSPLFLRVFTLMLLCVGVVQLMNVLLLVAVQTPSQKVYTVGEIVDAIATGRDHGGEFAVSHLASVEPAHWNPRSERIQLALATALQVPTDRVQIRFPRPFLSRQQVYDRAGIPRPVAPPSAGVARDVIVIGSFSAAFRHSDGSWVRIEPARGFEPWRWFVLVWLVLSAIAVGPFAWALAHRLAKPIGAFAEAAERLGRDPRAPPLTLGGPTEIAEAAAAFNQMQARLNRYVDDRTLVIGALAHDLRTPLMRLGLRLEDATDGVRAACEGDIRDMQAMISATLAYVRDTGQPAQRRPLDLRSLAETITDDLSDRGEAVSLTPGDPVVVEGNSAALKSMLSNLVSNAVKYAGGAEVSLALVEGQATLQVRDHGPGIPPGDLDHVFEPFFRGERSRNRDTGGIGLGLASARAVARAHGGDITLDNAADGGLMARVTLPA